ncbi:MAG: undecaprenyl-phosphate glucose phosphotransferase [Lachnospiraceae bacterium]|jgi:Undecaprenyl-phosphate glucose phosphotransferase|nr:undecaprenyl-phosphate glucose phosphotransferase [Lachnospiraceae bacterium]
MVKDYQQRLNRIHVFIDACVIAVSYILAWFLLIGSGLFGEGKGALAPSIYMGALVAVVPLYLALYAIFNLYSPKRVSSALREFADICRANGIGLLLLALVLYLGSKNLYVYHFSRPMVLLFFVLNVALETLERNCIRLTLRTVRAKGFNQKHVLLVGYSRAAEGFIDRSLQNPEWGYRLYGILDNRRTEGYKGVPCLGPLEKLPGILEENTLDEIAITLSIDEYGELERIVAVCEKSGVHTKFIPDYHHMIPTRPYTEDMMGLPVINIRNVPLSDPFNAFIKRAIDLFGAVVAIVVFSPAMLLVALLVRCTSKGPVIYAQERVGRHNRTFRMYKFRSMEVQPPVSEKDKWTRRGDPRVTPIGRLIRMTSLDETPQFFNVLGGSMSLVGPRPERPFFVSRFREEIPRYMIKHQVRPGITGWAQINGYRGDTSITKRIEHDLYYIENWSVGFDFKIIFLTIFKGLINKNAY